MDASEVRGLLDEQSVESGRASVLFRRRCSIDQLLAAARARLARVDPEELANEVAAGALIVDIRPIEQRRADGELPGAIVIDRNVLEWRLDPASQHRIPGINGYDTRIIVVCNQGYGSSLAAATLQVLGLHRATDLVGGYQALLASKPLKGDHSGAGARPTARRLS